MPKRVNVSRTNGGADIADLNALHVKLVEAAGQALENEINNGEIKAATLNTIRQICADAGVQPALPAIEDLNSIVRGLPKIDLSAVKQYQRT